MSKVRDADVEVATKAWFANTKHGWETAMRAALEAVSSIHEAEPVAWHTTDIRGRIAETTDFPSVAGAWRGQGYTVHPLFAHPDPLSKGMTVRGLEWVKSNAAERWTAATPWGVQEIIRSYLASPETQYGWFDRGTWRWCASLDEAKEAAQADFDARILSCLSHTAGEAPCPE